MRETIKETIVCQIEKSDLDLYVVDEILGCNPEGHDYDWVEDDFNTSVIWKENQHISIKMLQESIDELKLKGATHVQITPHSDHHAYYFTGVILKKMNYNEVNDLEKKRLQDDINHNEKILDIEKNNMVIRENNIKKLKKSLGKL